MSSPHYESYTTQHTSLLFDSFIRDNPVEIHAVVTVDKTGEVDEIEIEKVYLKSSKDYSENLTKVEINIDGLGSWNIDLDEGIGVYKDVTSQLEDEVYDKYMEIR
mgnify:CR=1 FL=1